MISQDGNSPIETLAIYEPSKVYFDEFEQKLLSGHDLNAMIRKVVAAALPRALFDDEVIREASEAEATAYHAAVVCAVTEMHKQFISELENITGCSVYVDVSIHSTDNYERPLFEPSKLMPGAEHVESGTTQYVNLAKDRGSRISIFGPSLPAVAE